MRTNNRTALEFDIDVTANELLAPFKAGARNVNESGTDPTGKSSGTDVASDDSVELELSIEETAEVELTPEQMEEMLAKPLR